MDTAPGGVTTSTPGQTDRVAAALAKAFTQNTLEDQGQILGDALVDEFGKEEALEIVAELRANPEVVMTVKEARSLTDCIKSAEMLLFDLLAKAYNERAWAALGYESWDTYCDKEFSRTRLRIPREERQELVQSLRDMGMTYREIGSGLGINHQTVANDLSKNRQPVSEPETPPAPAPKPAEKKKPEPAEKPQPAADTTDKPVLLPLDDGTVLDWNSLPGTAKDKLEVMRRQVQKELQRHRAKLEEEFEEWADAEFQRRFEATREGFRRRDAENHRIRQAHKGVFTKAEHALIRQALHPDSRLSMSEAKFNEAFRIFNDAEILLISEKDKPTPYFPLPDYLPRRRK